MSPEYIANSIVWSAVGLVIGLILGTGMQVRFRFWELNSRNRDRTVGAILILVALASTVQSLAYQRDQRHISDCQASYNERFQQVLKDRAEISDRDRRNTTEMVSSVLTAKTAKDSRNALEKYVATNTQLDRERLQNQFPALTGKACKEK